MIRRSHLLGFAARHTLPGDDARWRTEAYALHARLQEHFQRAGGGFEESIPARLPLSSNSHMHLLEAALAWLALDADTRWLTLATEIVELAQTRLMSSPTGVISEHFDGDWEPLRTQGWIIEPGHQLEWASLLLQLCIPPSRASPERAALRLIEFSETWGVDPQRRVVMNSCFADGRRDDAEARLWPQTERIKASCMAAEATGDFDSRVPRGRSHSVADAVLRDAGARAVARSHERRRCLRRGTGARQLLLSHRWRGPRS